MLFRSRYPIGHALQVHAAILSAIELQKLRGIELEPEPDYDDPLPDRNVHVINPVYIPDPADDWLDVGEGDVRRAAGQAVSVSRSGLAPDDAPTSRHGGVHLGPTSQHGSVYLSPTYHYGGVHLLSLIHI